MHQSQASILQHPPPKASKKRNRLVHLIISKNNLPRVRIGEKAYPRKGKAHNFPRSVKILRPEIHDRDDREQAADRLFMSEWNRLRVDITEIPETRTLARPSGACRARISEFLHLSRFPRRKEEAGSSPGQFRLAPSLAAPRRSGRNNLPCLAESSSCPLVHRDLGPSRVFSPPAFPSPPRRAFLSFLAFPGPLVIDELLPDASTRFASSSPLGSPRSIEIGKRPARSHRAGDRNRAPARRGVSMASARPRDELPAA